MVKFPTAVACAHSVAAVAREIIRGRGLRLRLHVALHFPRVLVETPAPPALVERIGKETSLPEYSCVFVLLSDQLSVAKSQKLMHVPYRQIRARHHRPADFHYGSLQLQVCVLPDGE